MIIYKTTNLINGKIYIGQDSHNNPEYLGSGKILVKAIKKYGKENFKKEILEECVSSEHLNEREKFWIKEYDAINPQIGYNIALGGYSQNPEYLKKCREKYWATPGNKEKISKQVKAMFADPNSVYNTPAYKKKMKDAHSSKEYRKSQSNIVKKLRADPTSVYNDPTYKQKVKDIYQSDEWRDAAKKRIAEFKKTHAGIKWTTESAERISTPGNTFGARRVQIVDTGEIFDMIKTFHELTGIKGYTYRRMLKEGIIQLINQKGEVIPYEKIKKPATSKALKKFWANENTELRKELRDRHSQTNQLPEEKALLKQRQQERLQTDEGKLWRENLSNRMKLENKYRHKKVLVCETGEIFETIKLFMKKLNITINILHEMSEKKEIMLLNKSQSTC